MPASSWPTSPASTRSTCSPTSTCGPTKRALPSWSTRSTAPERFPPETGRRGVSTASGGSTRRPSKRSRWGTAPATSALSGAGRCTRPGGVKGEGPEYETIALCGANCGVGDIEALMRFNHECDEWGLDTISSGLGGGAGHGHDRAGHRRFRASLRRGRRLRCRACPDRQAGGCRRRACARRPALGCEVRGQPRWPWRSRTWNCPGTIPGAPSA